MESVLAVAVAGAMEPGAVILAIATRSSAGMEATIAALRVVNVALICLLAAASLWQWHRNRAKLAGWLALAFGGVASLFVVSRAFPGTGDGEAFSWIAKWSLILAVAFPYFLFRFAASFRPAHHLVRLVVTGATGLIVVWTLFLGGWPLAAGSRPAWARNYLVAVALEWVVVAGYVSVRLWRDAVAHPGVIRRRIGLLSLASFALSLAVLGGALPGDVSEGLEVGFLSASLFSSFCFFLAFFPPPSVRTAWRRASEESLWRGLGRLVAARHQEEIVTHVLSHTVELLGAKAAAFLNSHGDVVASYGEIPADRAAGSDPPVAAGAAAVEAPLQLGISSGVLRVWASPYAPVFGSDEVELVRSMAALADLALSRARSSEKEAQIAALVASSQDAIIGQDIEGKIISWNKGAEKLYGYRAAEVLGQPVSMLFPPEARENIGELLEQIRQGEGVVHHELVGLAKCGTTAEVSVTVSPTRGRTGEVTGASTIAWDISEHRRREEHLITAERKALAASQQKSDFLSAMSHEIRTPMNGVIGMATLLLSTELTEEQRDYTETALKSAEALLTIINDILDLSKVEAGKLELQSLDFDLRTVIEEVAELLSETAHGKGIELLTLVGHGVPLVVQGDPGRVRQILMNLVGNALKFTSEGEVVVVAQLVEETDEEVGLKISVTDTGIGISPEAQGKLFQPFSQAEMSHGGTGLGLVISKRIVELMGGEIGLESEVGVGSHFWFTARLRRASVAPEPLPRHGLKGRRVLVVDHNATSLKIADNNLHSWGTRPSTAASSAEVMELLRLGVHQNDPYEVALLDHHLPELNGLELARSIRADPHLSDLRLILLTSAGRRGDAARAHDAGIDGYLTRPVRVDALYDTVSTVMGLEAGSRRRPQLVTKYVVAEAKARGRAHVLVVEDNPVNQKVAARLLERLGYRVDVAPNGIEAIRALERIQYAAVLMDCNMPEMDGYEATREIRRLEAGSRRVPIIAMTANALTGHEERTREAGMDDFVTKPVSPEVLAEVLDRWIGPGPEELPPVPASPPDGSVAAGTGLQPAVQPDVLAHLDDMDHPAGDMLGELVGLYVEGARCRLESLRVGLATGDQKCLLEDAHALKGSSLQMGALPLAQLCEVLEARAKARDLATAATLVEAIELELPRVAAALEEVLRNRPTSA